MGIVFVFSLLVGLLALITGGFCIHQFRVETSKKRKGFFAGVTLACAMIFFICGDLVSQITAPKIRSNIILSLSGKSYDVAPGWGKHAISEQAFAQKKSRPMQKACRSDRLKVTSVNNPVVAEPFRKNSIRGFLVSCVSRKFALLNNNENIEIWHLPATFSHRTGERLEASSKKVLPLKTIKGFSEGPYRVSDVQPLSSENWLLAIHDYNEGTVATVFNRPEQKIEILNSQVHSLSRGEDLRVFRSIPLNRHSDLVVVESEPLNFSSPFPSDKAKIVNSKSQLFVVDRVRTKKILSTRLNFGRVDDLFVDQENIYLKLVDDRQSQAKASYIKLARSSPES